MITIHRLLWGLADKLIRTRPQRASRSIKLNVRACLCTTKICARFPSGRSFDPDPCDKQATARAQKNNPLIDSKLPALQIRSPEPPLSLRLNRHCQLAGCRTTLLRRWSWRLPLCGPPAAAAAADSVCGTAATAAADSVCGTAAALDAAPVE